MVELVFNGRISANNPVLQPYTDGTGAAVPITVTELETATLILVHADDAAKLTRLILEQLGIPVRTCGYQL